MFWRRLGVVGFSLISFVILLILVLQVSFVQKSVAIFTTMIYVNIAHHDKGYTYQDVTWDVTLDCYAVCYKDKYNHVDCFNATPPFFPVIIFKGNEQG